MGLSEAQEHLADPVPVSDWSGLVGSPEGEFPRLRVAGLPLDESLVRQKIWQYSPPTRFGEVYHDEIKKSDNITAFLYANVVDLLTDENARHVTGLKVACLNGKSFDVTGRDYVLATGGLENPRLLLSANGVQKEGIGNGNDLVGRFFMEHPHIVASVFMLTKADTDLDFYMANRERGFRAGISLTEEVQRLEGLLSFVTILAPARGGEESAGYTSLREIVGGWRKERIPDDLWKHIGNVIADLDDVASALYGRYFGVAKARIFLMHANAEQAPNPDSRVRLADELDALGMRRIALDWRLSEQDKFSLIRSLRLLAEEIGRAGLGRIKILLSESDDDWPLYLYGGQHHMETTRMVEDRQKGVVDENCRVHGIDNLYIAGSSVFPVSGVSNPTLTIVALALRLADHLARGQLSRPTGKSRKEG